MLQGKISADDIKRMAKDLGENFTDAEIREMVEEADRDRKLLKFLYFFLGQRTLGEET